MLGWEGEGQELLVRVVELVEDDVVGQVDSDGVGVEQGDEDGEDGEGVVMQHGDEGELGVVEGPGDDEVGVVVGLGKGKQDTPGWGGFLGSECNIAVEQLRTNCTIAVIESKLMSQWTSQWYSLGKNSL